MVETNFKKIRFSDYNQELNSLTIYNMDYSGTVLIKEYKTLNKTKTLLRKETKYVDPNYFDTFFEVLSLILENSNNTIENTNHSIKLEIEYEDKTKNLKINSNKYYKRDSIDQIFYRLMRTADTVFLD